MSMTELIDAPVPTKSPGPRPILKAPVHRKALGVNPATIFQWLVLGGLALLLAGPVIPIVYQSIIDRPLYEVGGIFTLDNYVRLFTEAGFGSVMLNTAIFALSTTAFALIIAVPMAILVVRTKLPFGRTIGAAMQWPFFISSLILGFGWITLYGPAGFISVQAKQALGFVPWDLYSMAGMAVTEGVALAPIAYVFCANALKNSDASLESAAQVAGSGPLRIVFQVILPQLRPPIVYGAILIFSMSIETLSLPLLYGKPVGIEVFSTFLYSRGLQSIRPDYGILGAASTLVLIVTISIVVLQGKVLKNSQRFVSVRGKATKPRRLNLGWMSWAGMIAIVLYLIFGALLPILGLVFRSFTLIFTPLVSPLSSLTLRNYQYIFTYQSYIQSIWNSLIIAVVGAVLVTFLALVAALVARRSTFRFRRAVEYLALAPQAIPGIIVGIGLFWAFAYLPAGFGGLIQGTLIAVMIGFGIRALPSAFGSIAPSMMQIAEELDNAARVSGAAWMRTVFRVIGTLLVPAFVGSMILVFVTMLKEYSPAIFLASADSNVIGRTMLELWVQGNTGGVAALATLQIAITAVVVGLAGLLMKGHKNA
jgi:iron(III) transport system permease protein